MRRRDLHVLWNVVVSPRTAFDAIVATAPLAVPLGMLSVLQALVLCVQAGLLRPAVTGDPLLVEAGTAAAASGAYWVWRGVSIAAWPLVGAARAAALATLLQCAGLLLGGQVAWRRLVSLALCLDLVFWFEGVAITLLLRTNPPHDLESLSQLRLHAGLDLIWRPEARWLASGLEAANAFTLWWSVLLALGLQRCLGLAPARAIGVAALAWCGLVAVRAVFAPA